MQSRSHPPAMNRSIMLDKSRTRLLERTRDVGDPMFQIPRKPHVAASRRGSIQKSSAPPTQNSKKRKVKPETSVIRRDSKQQLNIACDGKLYEKAKSRRVRQRVALQQSGDQEEAVALGTSKNMKPVSTKSFDVQDLEKQFEQKSFARRAKIAHGLQQMQKQETKEPMKKERRTMLQTKTSKCVTKHNTKSRRVGTIPPTKKLADTTNALTQGQKPKQKRPSTQQKAYKRIKPEPAIAITKKSVVMKDLSKSKIITTVKEEPCPEVIDLLSDSETDDDNDENGAIQALTQLLQTEAIGYDATHQEMKEYAHHLFGLGLHSREMILRALDFDSDASNATKMKTKTAAQVVNRWKWMKPFHKIIFKRWIGCQQR